MYCRYCDKEFPAEVTICPDCFADLRGQAEEPPPGHAPEHDPAQAYFERTAASRQEELASDRTRSAPAGPGAPEPAPELYPMSARPSSTGGLWTAVALLVAVLAVGGFWFAHNPGQARKPTTVAASSSSGDSSSLARGMALLAQARQYYERKQFHRAASRAHDAIAVLKTSQGSHSDLVAAHELAILALMESGDDASALAECHRLASLAPDEPGVQQELLALQARLSDQNRARADRLVADGFTALSSGQLTQAAESGRQALGLYQQNGCTSAQAASAYRLLGKTFEAHGDTGRASFYFSQAVSVDPSDSVSRRELDRLRGAPATAPPVATAPQPAERSQSEMATTLPSPSYPTRKPQLPDQGQDEGQVNPATTMPASRYPVRRRISPQRFHPRQQEQPGQFPPRRQRRRTAMTRGRISLPRVDLPQSPDFDNPGPSDQHILVPYDHLPNPNAHPPGY